MESRTLMNELEALVNEFEAYLNREVEKTWFSQPLYRGDRRGLDEIRQKKGFFPKDNEGEKPTIRSLVCHCAKNSFGGPFISTSERMEIARGFGGNLYRINAGMPVVAASNWDRINTYRERLEAGREQAAPDTDITLLNRASRHIQLLRAALQYNNAQQEQLVVGSIPIQVIKLI